MRFFAIKPTLLVGSLALASQASAAADASTYTRNAGTAAAVLVKNWYNHTSGVMNDAGWWNTAVALTALTDLSTLNESSVQSLDIPSILMNTYTKNKGHKFLNAFYDDEGWWALALMAAHDATGNQAYLTAAADIAWDMVVNWGHEGCMGMYWGKAAEDRVTSSISNLLFLSVSAHLAARVPQNQTMYTQWAQAQWAWIQSSKIIGADGAVTAGINNDTCAITTSPGQVISYHSGVLIGGLVELNKVAPDPSLIAAAQKTANGTMHASLFKDENGIFTEPVGRFSGNTAQFKGILLRNIMNLQRVAPNQQYVDFATKNADSIWQSGKFANGSLSASWDQTNSYSPPMASHSSALECLIAAAEMSLPLSTTKNIVVD